MMLSPKAVRFVDMATDQLPPADRAAWNRADHNQNLPFDAARAALGALGRVEAALRSDLKTGHLTEDDAADASNDLGFVLAVEHDLRRAVER